MRSTFKNLKLFGFMFGVLYFVTKDLKDSYNQSGQNCDNINFINKISSSLLLGISLVMVAEKIIGDRLENTTNHQITNPQPNPLPAQINIAGNILVNNTRAPIIGG